MPITHINQIDRILIAIFALVPVTITAADNRDPAAPAPHGWVVYSTGSPGDGALRCASNSMRVWSVSLEGDTPLISIGAGPEFGVWLFGPILVSRLPKHSAGGPGCHGTITDVVAGRKR
jgi:hypothetical protein